MYICICICTYYICTVLYIIVCKPFVKKGCHDLPLKTMKLFFKVGLLKGDSSYPFSLQAVLPKTWAVKAAASLREFLAQWLAAARRVHNRLETLMVELE